MFSTYGIVVEDTDLYWGLLGTWARWRNRRYFGAPWRLRPQSTDFVRPVQETCSNFTRIVIGRAYQHALLPPVVLLASCLNSNSRVVIRASQHLWYWLQTTEITHNNTNTCSSIHGSHQGKSAANLHACSSALAVPEHTFRDRASFKIQKLSVQPLVYIPRALESKSSQYSG
jgi:hypothetical protein